MAMIDIIKQVAIGAADSQSPVAVMYGTVTSTSPIEVMVDQRFTLSDDFIVITEYIKNLSLAAGDPVLLLRAQGGQEYVIIDRLVVE